DRAGRLHVPSPSASSGRARWRPDRAWDVAALDRSSRGVNFCFRRTRDFRVGPTDFRVLPFAGIMDVVFSTAQRSRKAHLYIFGPASEPKGGSHGRSGAMGVFRRLLRELQL